MALAFRLQNAIVSILKKWKPCPSSRNVSHCNSHNSLYIHSIFTQWPPCPVTKMAMIIACWSHQIFRDLRILGQWPYGKTTAKRPHVVTDCKIHVTTLNQSGIFPASSLCLKIDFKKNYHWIGPTHESHVWENRSPLRQYFSPAVGSKCLDCYLVQPIQRSLYLKKKFKSQVV